MQLDACGPALRWACTVLQIRSQHAFESLRVRRDRRQALAFQSDGALGWRHHTSPCDPCKRERTNQQADGSCQVFLVTSCHTPMAMQSHGSVEGSENLSGMQSSGNSPSGTARLTTCPFFSNSTWQPAALCAAFWSKARPRALGATAHGHFCLLARRNDCLHGHISCTLVTSARPARLKYMFAGPMFSLKKKRPKGC